MVRDIYKSGSIVERWLPEIIKTLNELSHEDFDFDGDQFFFKSRGLNFFLNFGAKIPLPRIRI